MSLEFLNCQQVSDHRINEWEYITDINDIVIFHVQVAQKL